MGALERLHHLLDGAVDGAHQRQTHDELVDRREDAPADDVCTDQPDKEYQRQDDNQVDERNQRRQPADLVQVEKGQKAADDRRARVAQQVEQERDEDIGDEQGDQDQDPGDHRISQKMRLPGLHAGAGDAGDEVRGYANALPLASGLVPDPADVVDILV